MTEENATDLPTISTEPLPPLANKIAGRAYAVKAGKALFACFPDYEKTTAEFIATFLNVLATYETRVVDALISPKDGLPAKCRFVPTIADMVEMAATLERQFHNEDFAREEAARKAQFAEAAKFEAANREPAPGIGTDGKPCPRGCEGIVKDRAWWDGRAEKLRVARQRFPEARLDENGWIEAPLPHLAAA